MRLNGTVSLCYKIWLVWIYEKLNGKKKKSAREYIKEKSCYVSFEQGKITQNQIKAN